MWVNDTKPSDNVLYQIRISVQFASVLQSSGPSKDARDGVGAGWSSLQSKHTFKISYRNVNMSSCGRFAFKSIDATVDRDI